jgi:hypothetical protein
MTSEFLNPTGHADADLLGYLTPTGARRRCAEPSILQAVGAAIGVQRGLQQSVCRRRLPKHWFLASFALHRWLDSPRIVKTADYRPRWRAQALCWAPDHLTRAPLLRTDETTSRIA